MKRLPAPRPWTYRRHAVRNGTQIAQAAARRPRGPPTTSCRRRVSRDTARDLVLEHTPHRHIRFGDKRRTSRETSSFSEEAASSLRIAQARQTTTCQGTQCHCRSTYTATSGLAGTLRAVRWAAQRRSISARVAASSCSRSDRSGPSFRVKVGNVRSPTPDGLKPARSSSISARQSKLDVNILAFTRAGESAAPKKYLPPVEPFWTSSRRAARRAFRSGKQVAWRRGVRVAILPPPANAGERHAVRYAAWSLGIRRIRCDRSGWSCGAALSGSHGLFPQTPECRSACLRDRSSATFGPAENDSRCTRAIRTCRSQMASAKSGANSGWSRSTAPYSAVHSSSISSRRASRWRGDSVDMTGRWARLVPPPSTRNSLTFTAAARTNNEWQLTFSSCGLRNW